MLLKSLSPYIQRITKKQISRTVKIAPYALLAASFIGCVSGPDSFCKKGTSLRSQSSQVKEEIASKQPIEETNEDTKKITKKKEEVKIPLTNEKTFTEKMIAPLDVAPIEDVLRKGRQYNFKDSAKAIVEYEDADANSTQNSSQKQSGSVTTHRTIYPGVIR